VTVLGRDLIPVEYRGQRVATFRQVDEVHERPEGTAKRQFSTNRHRFVQGLDFFEASLDEIRTSFPGLVGSRGGGTVILLTKRGYGKVVKGWNDDRSWQLHDAMQDAYFLMQGEVALVSDGGGLGAGLPHSVRREIGGIVKAVLTANLPTLVRNEIADIEEASGLALESMGSLLRRNAAATFDLSGRVTASQIMTMAGVPEKGRAKGAAQKVSGAMRRAHSERAVRIPAHYNPRQPWVFAQEDAIDWLRSGGAQLVIQHHDDNQRHKGRRGSQAELRLVSPPPRDDAS
jgi:hypothetical protein